MRVLLITGELSGDLYASLLVKAVRELNPALHFQVIGGPRLRCLDVDVLFSAESLALVGIPDFTRLKRYLYVLKRIKDILKRGQIDLLLLVDFPGFNLRVAKFAKELGYPVIYFVAPQVWAWYQRRIKVLQRYVDLLYVILPFEEEFFKNHGVRTKYFGHPLLEVVRPYLAAQLFYEIYKLNPELPILSMFPGSRDSEVMRHIPIFLRVFSQLKKRFPNLQGIMVKAMGLEDTSYWEEVRKVMLVLENNQYDVLKHSDVALLASGTITLEAALLESPGVVVYSLPSITYQIAKRLIKVPYISLPNLLLQKEVYPEVIIEGEGLPKLVNILEELIAKKEKREQMKQDLLVLKKSLGPPGAIKRIAEDFILYLDFLKQQKNSA